MTASKGFGKPKTYPAVAILEVPGTGACRIYQGLFQPGMKAPIPFLTERIRHSKHEAEKATETAKAMSTTLAANAKTAYDQLTNDVLTEKEATFFTQAAIAARGGKVDSKTVLDEVHAKDGITKWDLVSKLEVALTGSMGFKQGRKVKPIETDWRLANFEAKLGRLAMAA